MILLGIFDIWLIIAKQKIWLFVTDLNLCSYIKYTLWPVTYKSRVDDN